MSLELAYASGQYAALVRLKLAFPAATHPVVQQSGVLKSQASKPPAPPPSPPTTPAALSQLFDVHEQSETRSEPLRKLSADLCTTCRKEKHYGPCKRPIPIKRADFNPGLTADDPTQSDNPATSAHYHAATTADSSMARARDGRPADEQAATGFADLFRHLGITNLADQATQSTSGLDKVALTRGEAALFGLAGGAGAGALQADKGKRAKGVLGGAALGGLAGLLLPNILGANTSSMQFGKLGGWQLWGTDGHSTHEQRGPSPNPYEERLTVKSPPVGFGDEGPQRIRRAFDQIDGAVDTANIGGGFGTPDGGPAVLG